METTAISLHPDPSSKSQLCIQSALCSRSGMIALLYIVSSFTICISASVACTINFLLFRFLVSSVCHLPNCCISFICNKSYKSQQLSILLYNSNLLSQQATHIQSFCRNTLRLFDSFAEIQWLHLSSFVIFLCH